MQILYLWIKQFHCYSKQGFNFGGPYRFSYNSSTGKLDFFKNKTYIKGFFNVGNTASSATIENVTGIVGENGTGKTILLKFIRDQLAEGQAGPDKQFLLVLVNENKLKCYYSKGLKVVIPSIIEGQKLNLLNGYFDKIDSMVNVDIVYFSNIFSGFDNTIEVSGVKNISTNFLLRNSKQKLVSVNPIYLKDNEVELYRQHEIERQIAFLSSSHAKQLKLVLPDFYKRIPKTIALAINDLYFPNDLHKKINSPEKDKIAGSNLIVAWKFLLELYNNAGFTRVVQQKETAELFIYNAISHYIYEKLTYSSHQMQGILRDLFNNNIFNIPLSNDFQQNIAEIINRIAYLDKLLPTALNVNLTSDLFTNDAKRLSEVIRGITNFSRYITPVSKGTHLWLIKSDKMEDFFAIYRKSYLFHGWINYDWHEISTGELSFLSQLSRLYSLSDGMEAGNNLKKNILILLDEPELGLHPKWQKVFLFAFIQFVSLIFANRNIQIILTGNQPIMISDLPNTNVIFLEKQLKSQKTVSLQDTDIKKRGMHTFGANIHDLYAHPFFMDDGFIGSFSVDRIKTCYEICHKASRSKKKLSLADFDFVNRCAEIIDEPFIRKSLLNELSQTQH